MVVAVTVTVAVTGAVKREAADGRGGVRKATGSRFGDWRPPSELAGPRWTGVKGFGDKN